MKIKITVLLLIICTIFSCSKKSEPYGEQSFLMTGNETSFKSKEFVPPMAEDVSEGITEADSSTLRERKRILNAYLEMTVSDVDETEKELTERTLDGGGWIVSSNLYGGEITLVVKIPAESFDPFLLISEKAGKVDSKSINTDDVTESFYDLQNRIENKKILRERFREYLRESESIEDILSVERQLNDVTTEIERLEGSFRGLNRDIDYSTITFRLKPPITETVSNKIPSFVRAFKALKYAVVTFLYYLLFIIIYLVIFGIPVILVLGLFYLTGWGRIGLIRRFFAKLKK